MCGFAGFLSNRPRAPDALSVVASRMADAITHRGPDDSGVWVSASAGIALAHKRLSVVDLSAAGHQPMTSNSGRFVLAFNGEIYNHLDLRAELDGVDSKVQWRGHSDTETLLACFERWGIEATLNRTVGMFAIALWDVQECTLYLARDRFGEKPLYFGWIGVGDERALAFGSELKALRAYPSFNNRVCRLALAQYMRFTYVPAPRSIYEGVFKLEPGCLMSVRGRAPLTAPNGPLRPAASYGSMTLSRWWSLADVVQDGTQASFTDERAAVNELEQCLANAVRLQSLADVPLGAFLSGGIDSSTIVALMQQQSTRPVKTFTVGFAESGFDEAPYARAVARHLGTDHTEIFVTAAEAQAVVGRLPTMYDEPFADSSQIPTHLVCTAARQQVTVALSGDAGDELFGGYNRYSWGPRIWSRVAWLPQPVRYALGASIDAVSVDGWDALGHPLNAVLPRRKRIVRLGDKAHKLAARLRGIRGIDDLYLSLVSEWQHPGQVVRGEGESVLMEPPTLLQDPVPLHGVEEDQLVMMYRDTLTYLPDDILCKVDRAAMAVSLETRVPFLDHRVAELAWRLPLDMKIRDGTGKWCLRQVLHKYVPRALIERPKAGFGIPIGQWLRGPLRGWAESLLNAGRLEAEGYFRVWPIRQRWHEHLSGRRDHTQALWAVLMFEMWLESVK